jgi:hypothetical protein
VNVETDIIGKYVARYLSAHKGGGLMDAHSADSALMDKLKRSGFMGA